MVEFNHRKHQECPFSDVVVALFNYEVKCYFLV